MRTKALLARVLIFDLEEMPVGTFDLNSHLGRPPETLRTCKDANLRAATRSNFLTPRSFAPSFSLRLPQSQYPASWAKTGDKMTNETPIRLSSTLQSSTPAGYHRDIRISTNCIRVWTTREMRVFR